MHEGQHSVDLDGYFDSIERCRAKFSGLRILTGIELGEPHWFPDEAAAVLAAGPLDQVLGSIHCIRLDGGMLDASQFRKKEDIDFPAAVREYFRELLAMVDSGQAFETLAHLDYPKRYWLDGAAPYEEKDYEAEIRAILRAAAQRRPPAGQGGGGFPDRHPDGRIRRLQAGARPGLAVAPLILKPTSPAHGGAAVAREDGKVWLVSYALPGEVVEAEPRGRQGGVAVAATTRVIEPSPHRAPAPCPYFGACGGCQLQHAEYAYQLELKKQVVEEAWARADLRLPPDTPVLGMDEPWRYRIRGEFEAVAGAEGWRFGFHRMRSHFVLPIDTCLIHDLRIEHALPAFAQAANEMHIEGLQNLLLTVASISTPESAPSR